jgi:hypothetical protein
VPLWAVLALAAIGAGFLVCAVNLVKVVTGASRRRRRGTTTQAVVVHVDERGEMAGDGVFTVYVPTLEFRDASGRARRFRNDEPVADCPRPGGTLTVWYDPEDPSIPPEVEVGGIGGAVGLYATMMALCVALAWFMVWFSTLFRS